MPEEPLASGCANADSESLVTVNAALVASWIEAIGTVGALAVALAFGVYELRQGRIDRRKRASEARLSQASLVNAWLSVSWLDPSDSAPVAVPVLYNGAEAPVYGVVFELPSRYTGGAPRPVQYGLLPPTEDAKILDWDPEPLSSGDDLDEPLELSFRDAAGIWWHRDAHGRLEELEADPYPDRW